MRRFWDLIRAHKKVSFGVWILVLVAVVTAAQWQFGSGNPILTQVLGAQAKKPDVTPPSVPITFPVNGGVYGPTSWLGAVRGSASDSSGVKSVEVQVDGGAWGPASGTTSWSRALALPGAGQHTVSVRATDGATPSAN